MAILDVLVQKLHVASVVYENTRYMLIRTHHRVVEVIKVARQSSFLCIPHPCAPRGTVRSLLAPEYQANEVAIEMRIFFSVAQFLLSRNGTVLNELSMHNPMPNRCFAEPIVFWSRYSRTWELLAFCLHGISADVIAAKLTKQGLYHAFNHVFMQYRNLV